MENGGEARAYCSLYPLEFSAKRLRARQARRVRLYTLFYAVHLAIEPDTRLPFVGSFGRVTLWS